MQCESKACSDMLGTVKFNVYLCVNLQVLSYVYGSQRLSIISGKQRECDGDNKGKGMGITRGRGQG